MKTESPTLAHPEQAKARNAECRNAENNMQYIHRTTLSVNTRIGIARYINVWPIRKLSNQAVTFEENRYG